jgi:immune inhibitor A
MAKRLTALCAILTLLTTLVMTLPAASGPAVAPARDVESLVMFRATKFDAHYRVPNEAQIESILRENRTLLPGARVAQVQAAVRGFMQEWIKRNPTTPNPDKLRQLIENEKMAAAAGQSPKAMGLTSDGALRTLVALVEFPGTDTFIYNAQDPVTGECYEEEVTTSGPLHNEIPPPGPRDNNTFWHDDFTPEIYDELYFGIGPDAGIIANHPNLGAVDLRGNTVANYFLEQSEGAFAPEGMVYPVWLQVAHSEGWYGADDCETGDTSVRSGDLIMEAVDLINAGDPECPWQDFDGDGNSFVDNFTVIHAGMGQEAGGGPQGDFSIWSHASAVAVPTGYLACTAGSIGCPDRDIYVREYSMDPENYDVGVGAEEYGHAAFGLPDIYTVDLENSVANWAIMSAGAWNGPLGGMQPAPFPGWFRYAVGWWDPVELDYDTYPKLVKVGQHSLRPEGTEQGIKINLPDIQVAIPNPLETGNAWWCDLGDMIYHTLTHDFDLTGATAPVFSFASYWSIEEGWDYGYVEVSGDGGATWTVLPDMDGILTDTDPHGNNLGWGLTGDGEGTLRFDLSAYAGMQILLRLSYSTDIGTQWEGWWADDFSLDDGTANLFADDVEAGAGGWATDGWRIAPFTEIHPHFYLVEWRNSSGFDEGLQYAYQTVYSDDDEWEVDRAPYTVPGMLVWLRNGAHRFDYALSDSLFDPPSLGPKHGLIVVDSHPFPYVWDNYTYDTGQNVRTSGRVVPGDAPFTLQDTTPFTLRLGYDPATGEYVEVPLETKTFGPRPPVSQFHDSMGYYPGLWCCDADGFLVFWDADASAVVPATGDYTTRITWPDNTPAYDLYGEDVGFSILGSGNPGDDEVQFGLHMAVVRQADDGSWGAIRVWNSSAVLDLTKWVSRDTVPPGRLLRYWLKVKNLTPVRQTFVLDDPIPEHTTLMWGRHYDPDTNSIHWEGTVHPGSSRYTYFWVRVDSDTPVGTIITNEALLGDGALGDSASVTTEVVEPHRPWR